MADGTDRLIYRAAKDPELMKRLTEIEELDSKCMLGNQMGAGGARGANIDRSRR